MKHLLVKKLKIARRASAILQLVPYIRMIALCNSVAKGKVHEKSDIDFFIIAHKKHIFTVRYLTIFLLTLFGLKSYPQKDLCADRACTSFFISNYDLNLDRLNRNKKDEILRADWILNLIPLFNQSNTYLGFVNSNSWVKKYYKTYYLDMSAKSKNIISSTTLFVIRGFFEIILFFGIGWVIEKIVRYIQINRLLRLKHSHHGHERMIINDEIIKLHFKPCNKKCELF